MKSSMQIARKFGSFHSSNIDEQLKHAEDETYEPPKFPVTLPNFDEYENGETLLFGKDLKEKHFLLDENWTFLNHGAFGCVLKEALSTLQSLQNYVETQPVRFVDREMFPLIVHAQKRLANFIGCPPTDISFVENATMGTNIVLNSLPFNENSTVFYLSTTYGAVKKSLSQLCTKYHMTLQEEALTFPIKHKEQIINIVAQSVKPNSTLAIFDHVPSNAAFLMPVRELVRICHDKNVPVLIDGAHALGAIDLNLQDIDADYYVSNAHKWLCNPKGCAFLYVKPKLQDTITALTVSHGHGYGFHSELTFTGLKDYTPYIALQCTLNFWNCIGSDNIRSRISDVLYAAVELLKKEWNGKLLAPLEMHSTMCCVSLPSCLYENRDVDFTFAEKIQNRLYHDHRIEVPIKIHDGKLYVRISVHIYNELDEYRQLATAVLGFLDIFD